MGKQKFIKEIKGAEYTVDYEFSKNYLYPVTYHVRIIKSTYKKLENFNFRNLLSNWQLKSIWKRPEPISAQQQAIRDGIVALEAKQQELIDQAEKIKADILKLKGM